MKRGMLFLCALILLCLSFAQGAFCRTLTDEEAAILLSKESSLKNDIEAGSLGSSVDDMTESTGRSGRADIWYSQNDNDMYPILGSKWRFSYKIFSPSGYVDNIKFGSYISRNSNGYVYLNCSGEYDYTGYVFYRSFSYSSGGDKGYSAKIGGVILDHYYDFKLNGTTATGYYYFKEKDTGDYSDSYYMTGIQLLAPNPPPVVDTSTCKIMAKSMTIDSNTIPTTNDTVKFTVTAISDCTIPLYYYYSYAPNYGTDDYDANVWIKVIEGSGFTSSNTFSQKFTNPGYYVVVAWISPKMGLSNPINMIGCTVAVK